MKNSSLLSAMLGMIGNVPVVPESKKSPVNLIQNGNRNKKCPCCGHKNKKCSCKKG